MQRDTLTRRFPTGFLPAWSWLVAALLLVALFVLLLSSGSLLTPLVGHVAAVTDYVHEFTHDGRHLLAVPCH